MSNPHIVMVVIDFAPWDSDVTPTNIVYEFNGPDEAKAFQEAADEYGRQLAKDGAESVGCFTPEPVTRFGNADDALRALKDYVES